MKHLKVITVLFFFILFDACKPSTNIDTFSVIHEITDYDSIYSDKNDAEPLGTIVDIEIIDNTIILRDLDNKQYYFSFIDVDKGELLTKWGIRGQGPGEYVQIGSHFTVSENQLVFLDAAKKEINYVPLSIILKQDSAAKIVKEPYPYTVDFRTGYLTLVGNKKIAVGSFKKGYFGILDSANNIVANPFDYPFICKEIDGIYKGSAFQLNIKSNEKQRKFVTSFLLSDIFEIYQVNDTNIVKTYSSSFNHVPQLWQNPRANNRYTIDYEKSIAGLMNMAVSEDFICFSYSSKSYTESANSSHELNEILCFDWNGKKVKKYILPFPIYRFCIDNNYIYGVRALDDEMVIYRFRMTS